MHYTVSMLMLHDASPRDLEARDQLRAALPDTEFTPPDAVGAFDIRLDASDLDHALLRVWDAVAATGSDDHVVFLEHPNLPEHWMARSASAKR